MKTFLPCAALLALLFGPALAHAELIHRFSFSEVRTKVAKDSVGKLEGRAQGNDAALNQGKLTLKNGNKTCDDPGLSYMALNGPLLPDHGETASVVIWFTAQRGGKYPRVLDIGQSAGGTGKAFLYFSPLAKE